MSPSQQRRMHMTPRLKFILGLILAPAAIYLLGHATSTSFETPITLQSPARSHGEKPNFHPYLEETEDGYGLHMIDEQLDFGHTSDRWSLDKIGLGRLTGKKRPSILITGGAGQLGQALIPRLTQDYTVYILDIVPVPSYLPSENVVYHRGSVLPSSPSLRTLLSSHSFEGILHLAAISLDAWCAPKEADCLAVNEGGVKTVMKQVEGIASRAAKSWRSTQVPWVVLGSSMEVYGDGEGIVDEVTERKAGSALGRTKAKGEEAFEAVLSKQTGKSGVRGMILRFSDVYGYSHESSIPESFVPHLVGNAITSMPIQYDSDTAPIDLLHVDDAVDGVLKAIQHLKAGGSAGSTSVNLVSGKTWGIEQVVERARELTNAMSPIMDIGDHQTSVATSQYHNAVANSLLGWSPTITLPEGFTRTFQELTSAMHSYSLNYLHGNCAPSAEFPAPDSHPRSHPADERNKHLQKLEGCLVQVAFAHDEYLHHMKCSDGKHCKADGEYVAGYNWNGTFWIMHAAGKGERKARVSFEEEKGMGWLGAPRGLNGHAEVGWELVDEDDMRFETDFDMEVARESSALRLTLPAANKQVHSVANVSSSTTWFALEDANHLGGDRFDMRINVVCCPTEGNWPLVLDDYESADVHFGHTGQIPANSSHRAHTCQRATESARHTIKQLQSFAEAKSAPSSFSSVSGNTLSLVDRPHDWAVRDLPACWNDCSAPVICVQTGSCRCVRAECPSRRENPLLALKHVEKPKVSSPSKLGALQAYSPKLVDSVKKLSFEDMLLPAARSYLAKHPEFIKIHVLDGYEGQEAVEAAECHKLGDKHCFSADNVLYKAMRSMQVSAEEADLIMLPVYQQCKGQPFMLHDLVGEAKRRVPGVEERTKKMGMVLTHDWGICGSFAWEVWSARQNELKPDWPLNDAIVMAVMGDYDSPCYRPHQDVVIPARSCRSNALRETFGGLENVRPAHERTKLLTWAGTAWGTGKSDRMRLTCSRGGAGEKELVKGAGPQSVFYSWDYMNELAHARFCPQPRGIAGWSPRTNDAIYAGCIPVIIAEGTHFPFSNFLDWTKFSVQVHPTDLDHIEQILGAIPLERVEELQANLAMVREGFLYSTDEEPEAETRRKGPMWFAMHEVGMRMRTKYPAVEVQAEVVV